MLCESGYISYAGCTTSHKELFHSEALNVYSTAQLTCKSSGFLFTLLFFIVVFVESVFIIRVTSMILKLLP